MNHLTPLRMTVLGSGSVGLACAANLARAGQSVTLLATGDAAQIEEERRLLYVAMTRARRHLALLVPQRFYVTQQGRNGDRHLYGSLTRFIPPAQQALFDALGPPRPDHADAPRIAPLPRIDVLARVRGD